MLRGNRRKLGKAWRLALALAGAAIVAGLSVGWGLSQQAEYERQAQHQSAEHASYARDYIRDRCLTFSVLDKIDCTTKARDEHRAYQRVEQDLVAQKTSALWTMIMGWAATFGMVLSAVGVYLVWTTFAETRRANEIASQAVRPWLRLLIENHFPYEYVEGDSPYVFRPKIVGENFGNAPAVSINRTVSLLRGPNFDMGHELEKLTRLGKALGIYGEAIHPGDQQDIEPHIGASVSKVQILALGPDELGSGKNYILGIAVFYRSPSASTVFYTAAFFTLMRSQLPNISGIIPGEMMGGEQHGVVAT